MSLFFYEKVSAANKDAPNVLLLTLDACRPDHFGCYGYGRNTTPTLDKLAGEGVFFTQAFSQSAWTTPGILSLFTSLYPPTHAVDVRDRTLSEGVPTLPKALKETGYAVPVLHRLVDIPNYWNLGFDTANKEQFQGNEGDDLLKLLEAYKDKKFFIWYHYHGLHLPYNPLAPYDTMFQKEVAGASSPGQDSEAVLAVKNKVVIKSGSLHFNPEDKDPVIALYDGQLRQMDDFVGLLLEKMKQWNIFNNTLIVITADHGEELLEHGFVGHASTSLNAKLYEEIIHIPLILWWPGKLKHTVIDNLAQQVDVMPTILELLGLPVPQGLQGTSLLPFIKGNAAGGSRPVFCETVLGGYQSTEEMKKIRLRCIRTKRWKLIYTNTPTQTLNGKEAGGEQYELYDLEADPKEERNVMEQHPSTARELKKALFRWMETTTGK